ncbi:3-dehydroquinate synthase [Zavarzinia sp. CC-PAN008]|uniref:3-dehydroquinate synthase n=1 Tax=Zavarzinia sp. CC-PAN008 TaxID=3243332 RepID=UPI003F744546
MMTPPSEAVRVPVELGERSYDILIGPGLLARSGDLIAERLGQRRVAVVADAAVAALHAAPLEASLAQAGLKPVLLTVPPGEESKSFAIFQDLLERLVAERIERRDVVLALGGGVVGDLAGFAASVLRRGAAVVQVPTTLLAMVDSAIGGKTAINSRAGKNLIGTFHQPRLVLSDVEVLATLPMRERLAGYAEIVKYGLIDDPVFFDWLEANGARVIAGEADAVTHAVAVSAAAKARVVALDEREEKGLRALLNLGHTFGHALEAATGFGPALLHGEGVAIGLCLAFDCSVRAGLAPAADAERVRSHLAALGLPTRLRDLPQGFDYAPDALVAHMAQDKKVQSGRLTFIMARGIGQAFVTDAVPIEAVRAVLVDPPGL